MTLLFLYVIISIEKRTLFFQKIKKDKNIEKIKNIFNDKKEGRLLKKHKIRNVKF